MIVECNWFNVMEHLGPTVIALVKEFYAKVRDVVNCVVQVHGKSISYSRGAINSYSNLLNILDDGYLKWGIKHYDLDNVIRRLCKPGTTWTLK